MKHVLLAVMAIGASVVTGSATAAEPVTQLRMYALDCGHGKAKDGSMFSDTGDYDGKSVEFVVPCFLIRHPKGTLIWDAGLNDEIAKTPAGVDVMGGNMHLEVKTTLAAQMTQLGLTPADVTYLGFSHLHFDHTGNANLFAGSTWLVNKVELAAATADPPGLGVDPSTISAYKTAKVELLTGDHDVFGDGSVRILSTPGHTPGHQVLLLNFHKSAPVVLSGDLFHTRENYRKHNVPSLNTDRADTLASFDRVDKLVKNRKARFVIQHAPEDFKALPRFPAYLD
jgi:glyoxylase-like metal-dependent hydrolase (beta-lactamase superfamily II)